MHVQLPDDLLALGLQFDEQRLVFAGVAIADDVVAVGKDLERGNPGEDDAPQVLLVNLPDDLLLGRHYQNAVAVAGADERVPVREPQRGEALVAESFGPMTSFGFLAEERNLIFPNDFFALAVVLADDAIPFMAYQIVAAVQLA